MPEESVLTRAGEFSRYVARLEPRIKLACRFDRPFESGEMQDFLDGQDMTDEAGLNRSLRELRKSVMLRLICRDLSGLANLGEVMHSVSSLAEISIRRALALHDAWMRERFGMPMGSDGRQQCLHVVAMGKLGGGELNVSSDIDLVFLYPDEGETTGPIVLSCQEYFTRLGRKLIASLSELTQDGFVFRVDMRLRPYGDSGALVASFSMLEDYLLTQGREWERYAWIKGRAVTGDRVDELMRIVRPFVYRKYLDFGAFGSLRELHAQIRQQVRMREMNDNIKLGPGGIREIEFVVQVFQLMRGGRELDLQCRSTLQALDLLEKRHLLPEDASRELKEAYVFLRNLEHRLQYLDDAQTQTLPAGPEERRLVAASMGFPDHDAFLSVLDGHRRRVQCHFEGIFSEPGKGESGATWVWGTGSDGERLAALGYAEPGEISGILKRMKEGSRYRHLPAGSQKRMDELVPMLARAASNRPNRDATLRRMLDLLETVSRRSSYLALLTEYPLTLEQVAGLASASPWASDYLRHHPLLLDELLDVRTLHAPLDWEAIRAALEARLREAEGDTERLMGVLRETRHATLFQLLVKDLEGLLQLEVLSDNLSHLADMILHEVLELCWRSLRQRHAENHEFAVIGYGKLGGRELGYASDLDIVFLYDDDRQNAQETYSRLAQRINTWLTSSTSSGILYETDLRLRPNGASGLLVSSVAAFESYQKRDAWIWEHQALSRGRYVTGSSGVGAAFEEIRREVLVMERDPEKLKDEIRSMRQKMLLGHPNPTALFDIKHDRGGIVDVEFIVQCLVLAHAHRHPQLVENAGNLALLGKMREIGMIPDQLGAAVQEAYREFRRIQHRLRLGGERYARIERAQVAEEVEAVLQLWERVFGRKSCA